MLKVKIRIAGADDVNDNVKLKIVEIEAVDDSIAS